MPNILDADIPITDIKPTEIGVESVAAAGRRVGVYGSQIASAKEQEGRDIGSAARNGIEAADNFVTHQQINAGAQHGEQLFANLTDSWNKTANGADPHDPSTAAKWREEQLEPALQQFTSGFYTEKGQQWAQERAEKIRSHMYQKSEADMGTLAKDAVASTVRTLQNTGSNTAFKDSSSLQTLFDNLDHSIEGIIGANPNLKGADAARVRLDVTEATKEQYVKAAIQGDIVRGVPWDSIANNKQYAPYINGAEMKSFEQQQKSYQKSMEVAQRQNIALQKQQAESDAHGAINDSFAKNVSVDDQGNVTIKPQFIQDMARLPFTNRNAPDAAEKAKTYIDWAQSQQQRAAHPIRADNPQIIDGLMKTIGDLTVSLDDAKIAVTKADIAKGLTAETRGQMIQLATDMRNLNNPLLTKTMEAAKEIVEPKYSGVSTNPGAFAKFYYDFIHNQYLPAKVGGTLPPDALDMSHPNSMISKALAAAQPPLAAGVAANGGVGGPPLPVYTAPQPGAPRPAEPPKPPEPGEVRDGYRFKGGNPADPKAWEPVT